MKLLHDFAMHRLVAVPRPGGDGRAQGSHRRRLFASLTAVHAALRRSAVAEEDRAVAMAWIRPPGAPLHVLVGGRPWLLPAPPASGPHDLQPILYPPGAQAVPVDDPSLLLDGVRHWVPCLGKVDALWAPAKVREREGDAGRGSFDDVVAHLHQPFAWLVLATPRPESAIADELLDLDIHLPRLRSRASSEADRIAVERAEGRYRELSRARSTGAWNVRVLAGAPSPEGAHIVAALLCSAAELDGQPYVLLPGPFNADLDTAATAELDVDGATARFSATTELLSVLARPPARELTGVRSELPQTFDLTPEIDGEIVIGRVLDASWLPTTPISVSRATLNRHTFICGATGSGKSQTVRALLEVLSRAPDPVRWLVIEPAKAEYARMAGRLAGHTDVTVIRPGDLDVAPASLNPLEPEPGFSLQGHADLVRALFLAAFEAHEPFPQVLSTALTTVYMRAGWDLVTGEPRPALRPRLWLDEPERAAERRYPTLTDLQATARETVESIGYGDEVTADVRGFVEVRIGSLRQGAPGRFFEGGHPLSIERLLSGNVVLELDAITNDQDKAFLMGAVLIRIVEHLRLHRSNGRPGLQHVTVIEEAHRLIRNATDGPSAAAVELFATLLAEIRAYGEGIVVVEQIPSKILPDVVKNTALKIVHRLPAADDREFVGATMNLRSDQSELVVALRPGIAAVAADGMDRPVLAAVELGEQREDPRGALTAPPVEGVRSPLCHPDCAAQPCTMRALNDARHLGMDPTLLVWIDAVVAAHLAGIAPPDPALAVRETVVRAAERIAWCALALAVERSVTARIGHLAGYLAPADLEERSLTAVLALLNGTDPGPDEPLRWTAGAFRWRDVVEALQDAIAGGATQPHPDTATWAGRGLRLDATEPAAQLDLLARHRGPATGTTAACVGDVRASGVAAAVEQLTGGWSAAHVAVAVEAACAGDIDDLTRCLLDALFPTEPVEIP